MPEVAFCRPLLRGAKGGDVIAHKRALSRWDSTVYPWHQFSPFFGEYMEKAVKEFQRHKNIQATGKIGERTHTELERAKRQRGKINEPAFDAYAIDLARDFCRAFVKTPEERKREAIVAAGFYWHENRMRISYSQYRPFQRGRPPWVPSRWDCSAFVTCCYEAGGAADPNGRGYDGLGYTGTLVSHGASIAQSALEPGDLVFYGSSWGKPGFPAGSPTHVALYVGWHFDQQMVLSLGSYPMGFYALKYRGVNHYRSYF